MYQLQSPDGNLRVLPVCEPTGPFASAISAALSGLMPTGDFCGGLPARPEQSEMQCPSQPQQELPPGPIELPPPVPSHFLPPPLEGPAYGNLSTQVHGSSLPLGLGSISNINTNNTGSKRPGQKPPLRKGKWTPEEEVYAHFIIENFNKGLINLPRGKRIICMVYRI